MTSLPPSSRVSSTVEARFNPLYRPYLVVTIGFVMVCTIIGIPLAIVWFCGVGPWWARHYFDKLTCSLDGKTLRFRKGILVQVEKTIPLENIQDVTFIEGPILKKFHLATLKFETAGQSAGAGARHAPHRHHRRSRVPKPDHRSPGIPAATAPRRRIRRRGVKELRQAFPRRSPDCRDSHQNLSPT